MVAWKYHLNMSTTTTVIVSAMVAMSQAQMHVTMDVTIVNIKNVTLRVGDWIYLYTVAGSMMVYVIAVMAAMNGREPNAKTFVYRSDNQNLLKKNHLALRNYLLFFFYI